MNISEMERLLTLRKDNPGLFSQVVAEKIKRETEESKEGKAVYQILDLFEVSQNEYLKQEQIDYYRRYAQEQIEGMFHAESNEASI